MWNHKTVTINLTHPCIVQADTKRRAFIKGKTCFRKLVLNTSCSSSRQPMQYFRISNQGHTMTLHSLHYLTNASVKYQLPTPYSFQDKKPGQLLGHCSKDKSVSHHDCTPTPQANVSTKYQIHMLYDIQDRAQTTF